MRRLYASIVAISASVVALVPYSASGVANGDMLGAANGEIAFSSSPQFGSFAIGTINPDGSGARARAADGTSPAWSPDGRRLAYISAGPPRQQHVMMRGRGAILDTNVPAQGFDVYSGAAMEWSPDGTRLAYTYEGQIWVMNSEPPFEPARLIPPDCSGSAPTWSPDSARVAYQGWSCMDSGIYIINADGTGNARLPNPPGLLAVYAPDWSPDGTRFAFLGNGAGGQDETGLWTMSSDGSDPVFLVATVMFCCGPPDWSPDGAKIAFIGDDGLSTLNADGTGLTVLREDAYQPKWRSVPEG